MKQDTSGVIVALMLALSASAGEREDALLSAVRKGDVVAVKALLDQGVPVDARFRYDRTALSFAADRGNLELVKLLLERGADVNSRDTFYKMTPVAAAAYKGHVEVARLLLAGGAAADDDLFFTAVESGNLELLGLDVFVLKAGRTPELIATNPVGEVLMATPAISDGLVIVRGLKHLFAFKASSPAAAR